MGISGTRHRRGLRPQVSHHPENKTLQIMGLGNGQENRVIARLRAALDDDNRAPSVEGGAGDRSQQVGLADVEGTGAGEQKSAWVEDLQGAQVQFLVTAQRRFPAGLLAGEGGRIEHNGIVALALVVSGLEEVKAVGFAPFDV